MLHSYGFIEQEDLENSGAKSKEVYLDLVIPDDDPLRRAKMVVSNCAPGVRISSFALQDGKIEWHSDFVWIMVVNEEDGLTFRLAQTTEGEQELQVTWRDQPLPDLSKLVIFLREDPLWPVYKLRADVLIAQRVREALEHLEEEPPPVTDDSSLGGDVSQSRRALALTLRIMEQHLLHEALDALRNEVRAIPETELNTSADLLLSSRFPIHKAPRRFKLISRLKTKIAIKHEVMLGMTGSWWPK